MEVDFPYLKNRRLKENKGVFKKLEILKSCPRTLSKRESAERVSEARNNSLCRDFL